ncbi:hypothetical protein CPB84DRAFT_1687319 [Gymnopilus junonius]|uniref:Uncharacterized protein n=1 Tax=Gymnopilus junonius TaxID=109634 RepID=A0A9P5TIQ9_GYMJU|nr:hypothetical protein CPB84DRAFT_1687319 [Gymnopilus junonius]
MYSDSDDDEVVTCFTLDQFYKRSKDLSQEDQAHFVKFTLAGLDSDGEFVVDPISNRMRPAENFVVTRDYDSLLGISEHIDASSYITAHTLARNTDSLSSNVHLKHHFHTSKGAFTEYLHKVPNICLGTWGPHNHLLRVYIPELYDPDKPYNLLSQPQQKTFYEQGLRPAIVDILEIESLEWPSTYKDEFWRSRGQNGQLRFLTKVIPSDKVPHLANALRAAFRDNDLSWHHGLVILHQIRGVKHASSHRPAWRDAKAAIAKFFRENDLKMENLVRGTWYIDVALNVTSHDSRCYGWRTDAHFHLARQALGINDHVAQRITSPGSSQYTRDMTSHLTGVSGWRIAPGVRAQGSFECRYFQGYTTDKSLTARAEKGHHGKFVTCADVLDGKAAEWADNLYQLNRNAIQTNLAATRMEMRVPLKFGPRVFLNIDDNLIRNSIISVHPITWWGLRSYRILACKYLFEWFLEGPINVKSHHLALTLMAALVWLLNGLHSAPDKGANSKRLMDVSLPHVDRHNADPDILAYGTPTKDNDLASDMSTDEEALLPANARRRDGETLPAHSRGIVFLRRICVSRDHPVPRFWNGASMLHPKAFRYFFGSTQADIEADLLANDVCRPSNPDRITNKTKRTPLYVNYEAVEEDPDVIFHLRDEGFELSPKQVDHGEDLQQETADFDPEILIKDDIDEALTEVYNQFILDITAKAPNSSGANNPSHLSLDTEARRFVTEETYKNRNLAAYFRDCQWKITTPKEWREIFDRLWPDKGFTLTGNSLQNYKQVSYYKYWRAMLYRAHEETVFRMKAELKKKFDDFYFMPYVLSDRIWKSMYKPSFTKSSGVDRRVPCPLVAICPGKGAPEWIES